MIAFIRILSPNKAPPVLRFDGSTEINPMVFSGKSIKGLDISLVGRNLWIIHKNLPYADPEEVYSAGNVGGHQGGAYPTLRSMGFNLKFKF